MGHLTRIRINGNDVVAVFLVFAFVHNLHVLNWVIKFLITLNTDFIMVPT